MFDRFGELGSYQEINDIAEALRKEKDWDSLHVLCAENGIDREMADMFQAGDLMVLCDALTAAVGKIDIEATELDLGEVMEDWADYLKQRAFDSEKMALAIRSKDKHLADAIGQILKWSFKNQKPVPEDIKKAAGVTQRVTMGTPGMRTVKKILTDYYLGA